MWLPSNYTRQVLIAHMDVYTIINFVFLTLKQLQKGYLKNLLFE